MDAVRGGGSDGSSDESGSGIGDASFYRARTFLKLGTLFLRHLIRITDAVKGPNNRTNEKKPM